MDSFFQLPKKILITGLLLLAGAITILLFLLAPKIKAPKTNTFQPPFPTQFPTRVQAQNTTQPLQVIDTSPKNNEKDVYAGEIEISFTTNNVISSASQFTMTITPPLPNYWKITNSYPANKITALVYGGLNTNTFYTITVADKSGKKIYSWSFTSSVNPGKSSSGLISDYEKKYNQQYAPLLDYTPYSTDDFKVGYESELTLRVIVKNPDIEKVKTEVVAWIKSHNVDPATHTINYIQ